MLPDNDLHKAQGVKEEFHAFCSRGRLAGTAGNMAASQFLKRSLEAEGYTAYVDVDRHRALSPLAVCAAFCPLILLGWLTGGGVSSSVAAALALGPMLRAAYYIHRQTPLAVFGVRQQQAPDRPLPTVVFGAHFDTASIPIRGSFLVANLIVVLILAAFLTLARFVSAPLAVLAAGLYGVLFFMGNASPGGDDNASGVFTVLACIRRLKEVSDVNVVPVFFNFEEEGLFGSGAWFASYLSRKASGIPGTSIDLEKAYVLNFDCVGRGQRIFVSGNKELVRMILATSSAQMLGVKATSLYPSDHLSFRRPWRAVSFAKANRYWAFDLGWLHSTADIPSEVCMSYLDELSRIVEEFVKGPGIRIGNPAVNGRPPGFSV